VLSTLLSTLLASLLLAAPAGADMHFSWARAQEKCLRPGKPFHPRFEPLADANHIDSTRNWFDSTFGDPDIDFPGPERAEEYAVLEDMRHTLREYADRENLDTWQRHCAIQCVTAFYFEAPRVGEAEDRFREASGMCSESTTLAQDLSDHLGLDSRTVVNGLVSRMLGRESFHKFSLVTVEGRRFVMNNNWDSDICVFRFDSRWATHREMSGPAAYLVERARQEAARNAAAERARIEERYEMGPRPGRRY
jgi:hypothetical protein